MKFLNSKSVNFYGKKWKKFYAKNYNYFMSISVHKILIPQRPIRDYEIVKTNTCFLSILYLP